jgi:hypothetical protein
MLRQNKLERLSLTTFFTLVSLVLAINARSRPLNIFGVNLLTLYVGYAIRLKWKKIIIGKRSSLQK